MQVFLTLTRRELGFFFGSIVGYVIIAGAVFLTGLSIVDLLLLLQGESTSMPITQLFYNTSYFWTILLLSAPLTTMRLFAQEKASGTFETLMTAPVGDLAVVMAKFTAAMVFYTMLWLPSTASIFILRDFLPQKSAVDFGILASTHLGIFLLGSLFISIGCFASAITRSQVVAAMISFTLGYTMYLLSYLPGYMPASASWQSALASHVSLFDHMTDFSRGVVDTRHVVFYVTLSILFLFLTLRAVQSRRWR